MASASIARPIRRAAYRAQQTGMLVQCLAGHRLLRWVARKRIRPSPDALSTVRGRYRALIERDLADAEQGLYPKSLLFQLPFLDYLRSAPALAVDVPRTIRRMHAGHYRDFPDDVDVRRYPPYFRRNFPWQTDGYFSRRSAEIYDLGVGSSSWAPPTSCAARS